MAGLIVESVMLDMRQHAPLFISEHDLLTRISSNHSFSGVTETVLTYEAYLVNAAKLFTARGANVIISSPTPNNPWESGTFSYSPSRFTTYSQDAATEAGGIFVDHGLYTAALYNKAGATVVDSYYPNDHTHTSPAGANVVARAFILALEATSSGLKSYITHD